jgi:CubicO group peptidase (beta-lactamase class C family)
MPFAELDACVARDLGVRYSAIVVRIERAGRVVYENAAGTLGSADPTPVFADTRFDLASITKVFVATVALTLVERGALSLDAPLIDLVPEWRDAPHAPIVLRDILAHRAGFQSGADYRTLLDRELETFALRQPLAAPPRERVIYSDLGFIVLGTLLARSSGHALRTLIERELCALGARRTTFEPRGAPDAVPATEHDAWRGLVQGSVHDEKAHLAGGVAGHAGLFGDARDVALLGEWYLAAARNRPGPLPPGLAAAAVIEQAADPVLRRGLGWALKTSDENSCGAAMSHSTFGHTGFTGTCVWVDPERDLNVVVLTNAVHFGRRDLREVRAALCNAACAAVDA